MNRKLETAEMTRLKECRYRFDAFQTEVPTWRMWGPYLSERQWGTVREDYSYDGNAWGYFPHDHARSRAYHWGEDGLAGLCDEKQRVCFALALWNGKDPIIKERLFGLTNPEGNHGEDVKEYYFYLDSTPTHSYMKYLYKYPQQAYPYYDIVHTNSRRSRMEMEYELLDTGIFSDNRYWDVFVEYAKESPENILIKITVHNRGPEEDSLHVLPHLWFRNTWSWLRGTAKPLLKKAGGPMGASVVEAHREDMGDYLLYADGDVPLLFTENETNFKRLYGQPNPTPYVKDGINDYFIRGDREAVNPSGTGTKAAAVFFVTVKSGGSQTLRLRLAKAGQAGLDAPFGRSFEETFDSRRAEADEFYDAIAPKAASEDQKAVFRQALAGMLWTKQYYNFDADLWLGEHDIDPLAGRTRPYRNVEWFHMINEHVISMPDKWEYPWYAAWDLAFHTIALAVVDVDFAKEQIDLMLRESYLHPSGQIPAYEWNFSDVNPPVHAWAATFLYTVDKALRGQGDIDFLKRNFAKLMLNFTWWVNRKDRFGKNVFEGGFLGLDNIGVFDRSAPLPSGVYLEQADGTAWMAFFCQCMMEMSVELAAYDRTYENLCLKFVEHLLWIASGINHVGKDGMWDEEDGFYYDVLRLPDGSFQRLKVRSVVGLLPLCAAVVVERWQRERVPAVLEAMAVRLERMPELRESIHATGPGHYGVQDRGIIALVNEGRLRRILPRMLDEKEFLSPYGIRSISRSYLEHPYIFRANGAESRVQYLPAESDSGMFGGNSNWRGPIWMPMNVLIIRALMNYYLYYGDSFKIECPTGSGRMMNLFEVSREIATRLTRIFLRDERGRRPVYGGTEKFQSDPYWQDNILFYEYFHGDNGAGIGASHQTGWTGLVASLIDLYARLDPREFLETGRLGMLQEASRVSRA